MRFTAQRTRAKVKGGDMAALSRSVYDVIEVIGSSTESWERAAAAAVETAAKSLRDLRIAEVVEMDMQIEDGKVRAYRTKLKLSFKYEKKG
jgi:dodecin